MVMRMRKVMAIERSWCFSAENGIGDYLACEQACALSRKIFAAIAPGKVSLHAGY